MSDDYHYRGNYHSQIITVEDTDYLVQGQVTDTLHMSRPVDELLECERDNVQKMYDVEGVLDE